MHLVKLIHTAIKLLNLSVYCTYLLNVNMQQSAACLEFSHISLCTSIFIFEKYD